MPDSPFQASCVESANDTPEAGADLPTVGIDEDEEAPSMSASAPPPLVSYDSDVSWSEQLEEVEEIKTPAVGCFGACVRFFF